MPNPGNFQAPNVMMDGMQPRNMMMGLGPRMMPPTGAMKPVVIRPMLQYDVMGIVEWKTKNPRQVGLTDTAVKEQYDWFRKVSIERQTAAIFHACKSQVWFIEQYHPDHMIEGEEVKKATAQRRLDVFYSLLSEGRLDQASWSITHRKKLHGLVKDINCLLDAADYVDDKDKHKDKHNDKTNAKSDTPSKQGEETKSNETTNKSAVNKTDKDDEEAQDDFDDELDYEDVGDAEKEDDDIKPVKAVLSAAEIESFLDKGSSLRTFSVELFFKTNLFVRDIEKAMADIQGFRRLSCARSMDLSRLNLGPGKRRMWATFSGVAVAKVLARLQDFMIRGQSVNATLAPRNTRTLLCPQECQSEEGDVALATTLIKRFDTKAGLWQTGANTIFDPEHSNLEKLVLYLRVVHSFDFFSATYCPHEDGMAQRMSYLTVPNTSVYMGTVETKWRDNVNAVVDVANEFSMFSGATATLTPDAAVAEFVSAFAIEKANVFQCPIRDCPKKFGGSDFVTKHIVNKHEVAFDKISAEGEFFNNYIADVFRCRLLPKNQIAREPPVAVKTEQQQQQQQPQRPRPLLQQPMLPPQMGGGPIPRGGRGPPHMNHGPPPMMMGQPPVDKDEFGRDIPLSRRNLYVPVGGNKNGIPIRSPTSAHLTRSRPSYNDL